MKTLLVCCMLWNMKSMTGMEWAKNTLLSHISSTQTKQNLNTKNSPVPIAINQKPYIEHLTAFIIKISYYQIYKYADGIGAFFNVDDNRLSLLCQREKKYCFYVEPLTKDKTTSKKHRYMLCKNKEALIADASKSILQTNPDMLNYFSLFLDRIAINNQIDEIQYSNLCPEEKCEQIIKLCDERNVLQ